MGDIIGSLPEKGEKRANEILALGNDKTNAEALMTLISTEKGKCKTAAQKALAQLDGLIPVFTKAILTKPKETVYDEFSRYLTDRKTAVYLYNVFGILFYEDCPKAFEKDKNYIKSHKKDIMR
ncbi:hypothetical protein [Paenibacillus sp. SYP-B3998]|uniref:hypothetical protein n=1 Tax=Paenibacillus sp. SYP-B3998 TaxID=2678564 RepID=UPI001967D666|nr:hypothetical protein [Paenibacillus sp. SYP-B3998]